MRLSVLAQTLKGSDSQGRVDSRWLFDFMALVWEFRACLFACSNYNLGLSLMPDRPLI